ncbi:hypothetical protein HDV00_011785, partial [Rhizophlyctis rosea]
MVLDEKRENRLLKRFVTKFVEEIEKKNIHLALLLLPFDPTTQYTRPLMRLNPLICLLNKRYKFRLSKHDMTVLGQAKIREGIMAAYAFFYVDTTDVDRTSHFVECFKDLGYIPGYNMKAVQPEVKFQSPNKRISILTINHERQTFHDTTVTYIKVCAGIGVGSLAMDRVFGERKRFLGSYEINVDANRVYRSHFSGHPMLGDITKVDVLPKVHLIMGGCPCQPFSVMGNRRLFEDHRGNVFLEVINLLKRTRLAGNAPNHVLFENVAMEKKVSEEIRKLLEDALGRHVFLTELNSTHFFAQERNRFYWTTFPINPPDPSIVAKTFYQILEENPDAEE